MKGKLIIFSAPSGSGKSTIIRYLLDKGLPLRFSISATSRAPRGEEQDGREYYFLTPDTFRQKIAAGEFLEYEEVYRDQFYGTLRSEIERIQASGNTVVLDVDVVGGCRIKEQYGAEALSVFIRRSTHCVPGSKREARMLPKSLNVGWKKQRMSSRLLPDSTESL